MKDNYVWDKNGSMHWRIANACNYNCSYCVSDLKSNPRKSIIPNGHDSLEFLNRIQDAFPGKWNFYFDGAGEPFLIKNFFDIIKKLIKNGNKVGVITNLSFPASKTLEFCEITKGSLLYLKASLHLEQADFEEFLEKAILVEKAIGDKFKVLSVARKENILELEEIGKRFFDNGIQFVLQPERDYKSYGKENPYVKYEKRELEIIKHFQGFFYDKDSIKFRGKLCWAGCKYFIVNENGDVWRCYPALSLKSENGYLGNLFKGNFNFKKVPSICEYEYCTCSGPVILE
jgi:MoaA/NifB/PqqE/SkfB family radical SAM enzyme